MLSINKYGKISGFDQHKVNLAGRKDWGQISEPLRQEWESKCKNGEWGRGGNGEASSKFLWH